MIDKALDFIQENIPEKWVNALWLFFTGLTFMDYVSIAWKCVTGSATLFFFWLAYLRHNATMEVKRLEKENMRLENEKLQQEIGDLIQLNKKKHG